VLEVAQTNLQLYNQLCALQWDEADLAAVRRAYELARDLFSGQYRASGKTFVAHAVGTASAVAAVEPRVDLVLAGLLHAAYTVGDFGPARLALAGRRPVVRAAVGAPAELVVLHYSSTTWDLPTITRIGSGADPLDQGTRDVLLVRLANEVDEHVDLGVQYADRGGSELYGVEARAAMVALARRLDHEPLARVLSELGEAERGAEVPSVLRSGLRASELRPPRSYRRRYRTAVSISWRRAEQTFVRLPGGGVVRRGVRRLLRKDPRID
jgi:hypothetical protein